MSTPPSTVLPLYPPCAPVSMPIIAYCDPLPPVLSLPPAIGSTLNVLLPTTSSTTSIASTPNQQDPQPVNPLSTLAQGEQNFPLTVTFHHRQLTTEPSPIQRHILPDCISVPNSTQGRASPPQSALPSANLSVGQPRELPIIDPESSEAEQ